MMASVDPKTIVLAAPIRTPIGRFGGALESLSAADLGTAAGRACLDHANLAPEVIDQVIFGHGRQAGAGPNTARQLAYRCDIPQERPAMTINQACGSGLQAVFCAARAIRLVRPRSSSPGVWKACPIRPTSCRAPDGAIDWGTRSSPMECTETDFRIHFLA